MQKHTDQKKGTFNIFQLHNVNERVVGTTRLTVYSHTYSHRHATIVIPSCTFIYVLVRVYH